MKEESVCWLSLSRHVTPWVFSSLKSCISHHPPSPWVTEWIHSCAGEKGGRSVLQWLLRALFPVPQPLFLTKTCQTVSLKGTKGRVTFLYNSYYAHLCGSVLVSLFSFINNQVQGAKTSLPPLKSALHASLEQLSCAVTICFPSLSIISSMFISVQDSRPHHLCCCGTGVE